MRLRLWLRRGVESAALFNMRGDGHFVGGGRDCSVLIVVMA